jgi:hypothetical protein
MNRKENVAPDNAPAGKELWRRKRREQKVSSNNINRRMNFNSRKKCGFVKSINLLDMAGLCSMMCI